mmetsp:Transcript_27437/g.72209  ORF Transcript_27437/g.72209 Transcript_27437/m.72209 type:complete len:293 (-) Transcript_27437:520-1398(-)
MCNFQTEEHCETKENPEPRLVRAQRDLAEPAIRGLDEVEGLCKRDDKIGDQGTIHHVVNNGKDQRWTHTDELGVAEHLHDVVKVGSAQALLLVHAHSTEEVCTSIHVVTVLHHLFKGVLLQGVAIIFEEQEPHLHWNRPIHGEEHESLIGGLCSPGLLQIDAHCELFLIRIVHLGQQQILKKVHGPHKVNEEERKTESVIRVSGQHHIGIVHRCHGDPHGAQGIWPRLESITCFTSEPGLGKNHDSNPREDEDGESQVPDDAGELPRRPEHLIHGLTELARSTHKEHWTTKP